MGSSGFATLGSGLMLKALGAEVELLVDPYLDLTWWMGHPLFAIIAILLLLVIAQAVLGLVSYLIKQLLLVLMKSPYFLFRWLLNKASIKFDLPLPTRFAQTQKPDLPTAPATGDAQERLIALLDQLEHTKTEHNQLLGELKQVLHNLQTVQLAQQPVNSDVRNS